MPSGIYPRRVGDRTVWKKCEICGADYGRIPSQAIRSRFCSATCRGAGSVKNAPRISRLEGLVADYFDAACIGYLQQTVIGPFVADFLCGSTVVEVDGAYWHQLPEVQARDARKTAHYLALGYSLIRLAEAEVLAADFSKVAHLAKGIGVRITGTSCPSPNKKSPIDVFCTFCGKQETVAPWRAKRYVYCSITCRCSGRAPDPETRKARAQAYRDSNRERINARHLTWSRANRKRIRSYRDAGRPKTRAYRAANRDKVAAWNHKQYVKRKAERDAST